jgi:hypothetical protein
MTAEPTSPPCPATKILQYLEPDVVGLSDHQSIAMIAAPVGKNGHIGAAKHDLYAFRAEHPCQIEGGLHRSGLDADACHIPVAVERKAIETQIADSLGDARNLNRAQNHKGERRYGELRTPDDVAQNPFLQQARQSALCRSAFERSGTVNTAVGLDENQ